MNISDSRGSITNDESLESESNAIKVESDERSDLKPIEILNIVINEEKKLENSITIEEECKVSESQSDPSNTDAKSSLTLPEIADTKDKESEKLNLDAKQIKADSFEYLKEDTSTPTNVDSNRLKDQTPTTINEDALYDGDAWSPQVLSTDFSDNTKEIGVNKDSKNPFFSDDSDSESESSNSEDDSDCENTRINVHEEQGNDVNKPTQTINSEKLKTEIADITYQDNQQSIIIVECEEDKKLNFEAPKSVSDKPDDSQSSDYKDLASKNGISVEEKSKIFDTFTNKVDFNKFTAKLQALSQANIKASQNSNAIPKKDTKNNDNQSSSKIINDKNKSPSISTSKSFGRLSSILSSKSIESETVSPPIQTSKSFGRLANLKNFGSRWKNQVVGSSDEINVVSAETKNTSEDESKLGKRRIEIIDYFIFNIFILLVNFFYEFLLGKIKKSSDLKTASLKASHFLTISLKLTHLTKYRKKKLFQSLQVAHRCLK